MEKSSKIFVAGHRGMVGSAICRQLQSAGFNNLLLVGSEKLDLIQQDSVLEFFKREKPEYVFLAAAKVGGIMANNTYRAQFIYENLAIQNNIIHSSYLSGVKKLLFLGSSCIYPRLAPQPLKEDCLLSSELEYTNEPYAIAKIAGIKMIESYNIQYGTNYLAVMPTNLYGPNDNYDLRKSHVLPAMIRKLFLARYLENNDWKSIRKDIAFRPIDNLDPASSEEVLRKALSDFGIVSEHDTVMLKLWGTGTPLREFMHVDDLAAACVHIMEKVNFNDLLPSRKLTDMPETNVNPSPNQQISKSINHQISKSPNLQISKSPDHQITKSPNLQIINTHINLGTGTDLSIRELAEMIKSVITFRGKIEWDPSKPDGTPRKLMDVSKMKSLGFTPSISLQEGINRTCSEYLASSQG